MQKAIRRLPSTEYLHQCFLYEAANGTLSWRRRPLEHFKSVHAFVAWNAKHTGKAVGSLLSSGYLTTSVCGQTLYVSRIIYKMHHGTDPLIIDHADRNPANNRVENLRSVTSQQNRQNSIKPRNNGCPPGVDLLPTGRYRAHIKDGPRMRHIGVFATAEEAHSAYREAANIAFGEFSPFRD